MRDPHTGAARESAGGRVVLFLLAGLVLLAAAAYVVLHLVASDKLARGTTVSGVAIGGRTAAQAERALRDGLAHRVDRPIRLSLDGEQETLTGAEAGLSVDYAASIAEVAEVADGEQSWMPSRLWDYYAGGDEHDAVVTVDEAALDRTVDRLARSVGRPPVDGDVRFRGGRIVVVHARPGEELDREATRTAITASFLDRRSTPAELTVRTAEPEIDDADVQRALDEFANPAMSAPVTLLFDKSPVRLRPADYGPALGMRSEDGALVPDLDERELTRLIGDGTAKRGAPVDAKVVLAAGKPKVVPAKPGVRYDPADVSAAFLELVTRTHGKREMKVEATVDRPDVTTKEARRLRIKERVSTFTTYYPFAAYRNINIGRAAELVDGTVLKPGDTFSLNDTVGERTRANGFTEGFIISDGIFKEDLGGGVSQLATTTFNAMFFAGLEDVEHKPHSFYIDRYPVGREATVAWGAVDLRFRNDTPYGVLVSARVRPATPSSQGEVTVSMYSTKYWDISSSTSDRYDQVPPGTRTLTTPDCYPNTGYDGFEVDVTRTFRRHGERSVDHRERFHTTYTPSDTVVCRKS